jgi:tetratricopeptide (TPR) repeat protein
MRRLVSSSPVLVGLLTMGLAACGQLENLKARKAFKEANQLYRTQDWRKAAAKYEETLQLAPDDPQLAAAYFYLGNSYDNLYRPTRQGEAENDAYLQKALQNYKLAAEKDQDPKMKTLALQYLVAAYGPDKLNDPASAEPIVQRMIELDPSEPANYFALAKLYEDAGRYDDAEAMLLKAKEAKPSEPAVYMQLARYYNAQGDFAKTMEALQERANREPNNPEAFQTMAAYYWEKAFRDFRLKEPEKREYIMKGIEATDKAIALKPDYMEALTYKNILLRMQANIEKDPQRQKQLLDEADVLRAKAIELQKKKTAGLGT